MMTDAADDEAEHWTEAGTIRSAGEAAYQLELYWFRVHAFLRSRGWHNTSSVPGCLWLWEKTIGGRTLLVDRDTAMAIERLS